MKRALSLLALSVAFLSPALAGPDITRESVGQRRAALDKMELQAFPAAVWESQASWVNGDPLKSADLDGKPALIVNWASWNNASVRALSLAQRMADKFGDQGLVVVGIHHPQGWESAAETAKAKGVKFRIAHDKDGAYRKALKIDHEPEYYLIDRAGHLRYASISSTSVEEAAAEVTSETVAQAGDLPRILKERADQELAQGRRTTSIRTDFELQTIPAVPPGYSQPPETAYKAVRWPAMDKDVGKAFGLLDNDGKALEPKLNFTPGAWYPRKPETTGRIQVIYFWHPDVHLSYNHVFDQMDLLQEQRRRDVAVIGALVGEKVLNPEKANQGGGQNQEESFETLKRKWDNFTSSRNYSHALAVDVAMTCLSTLNTQNSGGKFPIPGAMIVSTDGTIRWIGWINSFDFKSAIDRVVENDPGVRNRRAADRAYIEAQKK